MKVKGRGQPADTTPNHHAVELLARIDRIARSLSPISDSVGDAYDFLSVPVRIPIIAFTRVTVPFTLSRKELGRSEGI
jgi:hypothetical protein